MDSIPSLSGPEYLAGCIGGLIMGMTVYYLFIRHTIKHKISGGDSLLVDHLYDESYKGRSAPIIKELEG